MSLRVPNTVQADSTPPLRKIFGGEDQPSSSAGVGSRAWAGNPNKTDEKKNQEEQNAQRFDFTSFATGVATLIGGPGLGSVVAGVINVVASVFSWV